MKAKRNDPPSRRGSNTWIILLVLAVFVAGTAYWAVQRRASAPTEPGSVYIAAPENAPAAPPTADDHSATMPAAAPDTVPSYFASAEAAQPYPAIVSPDKFWNPVVVRAYQVAHEIPGTLDQQPCYCFCYRIGHRGLLDCFASEHGSNCSVCVQEALLADQMTKQGRSAAQIREAIIRGDWRNVELN